MENLVYVFGAAVLGLSGLLWMMRQANAASRLRDPNRARTFRASAYRPMERLLAEQDFEFLRLQPGYRPDVERRLRTERRAIFRHYLRNLGRDFRALESAVRELILTSPQDQSALLAELARQNLRFRFGVARVELRLALDAAHLGGARPEVGHLIEAAQRMSVLLRTLAEPGRATVAV
jgi:hypothetical protein